MDVEAATARGIPVGNTPGVLTESTADLALALMLGIARRLAEGEAFVKAGEWATWEPGLMLGRDLHGATVGIVGYGRIGQAVGRRLEGFGCELLTTSRSGGVPLEELLERSDFVTLHCPLTPETRGLIGAEALRRMKPTAYLVNTARGPVVDTDALAAALRGGEIAGAALDVTDPEPLPGDHPLLGAPNLLVVPHVASATHATRGKMADMAVDNLLAGLAGEPMPNSVNGDSVAPGLLPKHLDDHPLRPPAVELAVEDLLPGAQVEPAVGHGHDHLVVDEQVLQVRVAVVLAAAVMAVVARIGQELARHVVRRLLPARRRHLVEPLHHVLVQAWLVVVDPHRGGDVHRADERHALADAGLVDRRLDVLGDPDELAAALRVEGAVDRVRLHRS